MFLHRKLAPRKECFPFFSGPIELYDQLWVLELSNVFLSITCNGLKVVCQVALD